MMQARTTAELFVPAGTPENTIEQVQSSFEAAGSTPAELRQLAIVKQAGVRPNDWDRLTVPA
jgi:hypothetical protein